MTRDEAITEAARTIIRRREMFGRDDHLPVRSCLGCGGAGWEFCTPRGIETGPSRATWAEVSRRVDMLAAGFEPMALQLPL